MVAAAATYGMPLEILELDDAYGASAYGSGLLLVRPDQHVAWRGPDCPDVRAAEAIIARVLGWGSYA
jgi:hypothetical protein